jgi:hypothetical protein
MEKVLNILVILCIIVLLLLGIFNVISPTNSFELYGVEPMGTLAFSTIRGAIGGNFISGGLIILMGLLTKNKIWYLSSLLHVSVILICRFISVIFDGWTDAAIPAIGTEVFVIVVMYFAAKQLDASTKKQA